MPLTKHKIFKIGISDGKFELEKTIQSAIDSFLEDSNNLYINHSITILTEDVEKYGRFKTVNKYLILSLIYKDLNATEFDIKKVSTKVKKVVTKELEGDEKIIEPQVVTQFEKDIQQEGDTLINIKKDPLKSLATALVDITQNNSTL